MPPAWTAPPSVKTALQRNFLFKVLPEQKFLNNLDQSYQTLFFSVFQFSLLSLSVCYQIKMTWLNSEKQKNSLLAKK